MSLLQYCRYIRPHSALPGCLYVSKSGTIDHSRDKTENKENCREQALSKIHFTAGKKVREPGQDEYLDQAALDCRSTQLCPAP